MCSVKIVEGVEVVAVIVTADDDEAIRSTISRVLRRFGHTVIEAVDGRQALERVREHRPDLVLLDGMMPPGMSGFEASQRLRDDPDTAAIPVVMVTGSMSPEQVRQRLPFVSGVVSKPFTAAGLRAGVEQVLTAA